MGISSEEKQNYHNKGEQDYTKGEYNSPASPSNTLCGFLMPEGDIERHNAYDVGYDNARKQDK